jgi:hypothetical protein
MEHVSAGLKLIIITLIGDSSKLGMDSDIFKTLPIQTRLAIVKEKLEAMLPAFKVDRIFQDIFPTVCSIVLLEQKSVNRSFN